LYSVGSYRNWTMMQPCASAAKLRGSGPILNCGSEGHVLGRVAATSDRYLQPITDVDRPQKSVSWSRYKAVRSHPWAQDDAIRDFTGNH
jgi:hypothetical protein